MPLQSRIWAGTKRTGGSASGKSGGKGCQEKDKADSYADNPANGLTSVFGARGDIDQKSPFGRA